ncbi:MAG: GAF domain-containing protein, partial [Spirochaetales bacterium]|nr:GAF domain-containing protein [Spirochaetales bacterium]
MKHSKEIDSKISQIRNLETDIKKLTEISVALSKEKDRTKLLEKILIESKNLSNADGGTLYMIENENELRFEIVTTDSLNIFMGGTSDNVMTFPNLHLYDKDGNPNTKQIATYVALTGETINIPNAYEAEGFDFSGTRAFDKTTGYHSQSFLTVPLKNHEDNIIGVLQLINARLQDNKTIIPFDHHSESIVSALASQAAITITNKNLVKDLRVLFESFIKVIAGAIDKKSPYTGGHCQRVPVLTMAIANAVNDTTEGIYKDVNLNHDELYELHIASWLHDAGKVTIPEYVVDKGTKL